MQSVNFDKLSLNRPQTNYAMNMSRMRGSKNVWGRGTGKSFQIALLMDRVAKVMPRCTGGIQGVSFQQLLTRTLPGTFESLELLGYRKDIDYFINKKPTADPDKLPFYKPLKWDNYITVKRPDGDCVGFVLLSQDRSSSRGPNLDIIISDEALLMDIDAYRTQTTFTNRGHNQYYKGVLLHHSEHFFSSMPTGDSWLFGEDYYLKSGFDLTGVRNSLIDLQLQFVKTDVAKEKLECYNAMLPLMDKLKYYVGPKGQYYSEWNIFDNLEHLGLGYIDDMYKNTPENIFLVEGLNKRVGKIPNGFYPTLNRQIHGYRGSFDYNYLDNLEFDFEKLKSVDSRQDADCIGDLPLEIGLDFGTKINWLVVGQEVKSTNTFNFIKNFYVKSPKIIDHLVKDFIEYYKHHPKKIVYMYPDSQGNWKLPNTHETFVDTIKRLLQGAGWHVVVSNNKTYNKLNHDTYLLWARILNGGADYLPKIGFNMINCKELIYSMEQAPSIDDNGKFKKNKSSESNLDDKREEATDASDAADQIIYYKYQHLLKYRSSGLPWLM